MLRINGYRGMIKKIIFYYLRTAIYMIHYSFYFQNYFYKNFAICCENTFKNI